MLELLRMSPSRPMSHQPPYVLLALIFNGYICLTILSPKVIDAFNDEVQQAAAAPAPAFLDEIPYQDSIPNGRASEVLRQLAILYLNDPNSQLAMMRMEPDHVDGVTVVITLKLTNL